MTGWILFALACWIGFDAIFVWLAVRYSDRSNATSTVESGPATDGRDPGLRPSRKDPS